MSEHIYRVVVRTTSSLQQPERNTCWQQSVAYCGPSLRDARIAYLRELAADYGGGYGNRARDTVIEQYEAEPAEIDDTSHVVPD